MLFELVTRYCFEPNKKNFVEAVNELRKAAVDSQEKVKLINLLYMRKSGYFDFIENIKWYFNTGSIDSSFLGTFFVSFYILEENYSFTQEIFNSFQWLKKDISIISDSKLKLQIQKIIQNTTVPDLPFREEHDFSKRWRKLVNLTKQISPSEIIEAYQSLITEYEGKVIKDEIINYQFLNLLVSYAQFLYQNNQNDKSIILIKSAKQRAKKHFFIPKFENENDIDTVKIFKSYLQDKSYLIHEIALIYQLEGKIYYRNKEFTKAKDYLIISLKLWKTLFDNIDNIFDILTEFGETNWLLLQIMRLEDPNFSDIHLFEEISNIYQTLIDLGDIDSLFFHKRLGESLFNQATANIASQAELDSINQYLFNALDEFIEALELTVGQSDNIRLKIVDICFTIGLNFCEQSQLLEALDAFLQGTQYINDTNNEILQEKSLMLHLEYARVLFNIRDNSQALSVLLQTLSHYEEFDLNYPDNNLAILIKFSTLELLSRTLMSLGNLHEAFSYIKDMLVIEKIVLRATETLLANLTRYHSLYLETIASKTGVAFIFLSEYLLFNEDYSSAQLHLDIPIKLIESEIKFKINNYIDLFPALFYKNILTKDPHKKKQNKKLLKNYLKTISHKYNAIYERESFLSKIIKQTTNILLGILLEEEDATTSASFFIEKAIIIDEDVSRQIGFLYTFLYPSDFHWMASFALAKINLMQSNLLQAQFHLSKIDEIWESNTEIRDLVSPFIAKQIAILRKNIAIKLWQSNKYYDALDMSKIAKNDLLEIIDKFTTEIMPIKIIPLEIEVIKQSYKEIEWLISLGKTKTSADLIKSILPRLINLPESNQIEEIVNIHLELLLRQFSTYIFDNNRKGATTTIIKIQDIIVKREDIINSINQIKAELWNNVLDKSFKAKIILKRYSNISETFSEKNCLQILTIINEILRQNKDQSAAAKELFNQEINLLINSMKYSASISQILRIITLIESIKAYKWTKNQSIEIIEKLSSFTNNIKLNMKFDFENEDLWKNLLYITEAEIVILMYKNKYQPEEILAKIDSITTDLEKIKFLKIELNLLIIKTLLSRLLKDYCTAINSISEAIELTHGLRLVFKEVKVLESMKYEDLGYILLLLQYEQWNSSENPQLKNTGKIIQFGEYITNINLLWKIEKSNLRPSINSIKNKFLEKISQKEIHSTDKEEFFTEVKILKQNQKTAIRNLIRHWKKPVKLKIKEFNLIKEQNLIFMFIIRPLEIILTYTISDGKVVDIRTVKNLEKLVSAIGEFNNKDSILITNNFYLDETEKLLAIIKKEKGVTPQVVVNYSYIIRSFYELEKDINKLYISFPQELEIFKLSAIKERKTVITGYFISSVTLNDEIGSSVVTIGSLRETIMEISKRLSKFGVTKLESIALLKRTSIVKGKFYQNNIDFVNIIRYLMYLGFYAIILYDEIDSNTKKSEKISLKELLKSLKNPQIYGYLHDNVAKRIS